MDELLLDTTFLLPLFGVRLDLEGFVERFPRLLKENSVVYNPASIIESKWVVVGLARKHPKEREALLTSYRQGLGVLLADRRIGQTLITNPEVEARADELLKEGVRDYFDRMLCATAAVRGCTLMTQDEELLGLAPRVGGRAPNTIDWKRATAGPR